MSKQRCLDLGSILGAWLDSIEGNSRSKFGAHSHRQLVHYSAAETEADGAELSGAIGA